MADRHVTDQQHVLADLARQSGHVRKEASILVSPGSLAGAWAVKIKSHVTDNVYNVRAVTIGQAGCIPVEVGQEIESFNLAESFVDEGALASGTYAVMFRVGDKNVFYATP